MQSSPEMTDSESVESIDTEGEGTSNGAGGDSRPATAISDDSSKENPSLHSDVRHDAISPMEPPRIGNCMEEEAIPQAAPVSGMQCSSNASPCSNQLPSTQHLHKAVLQADEDGSGTIDFQEFKTMLQTNPKLLGAATEVRDKLRTMTLDSQTWD